MIDKAGARQSSGWRRSSRCSDAACLEVNSVDGDILVRSTGKPEVELRLTAEQWRSLLDAVKSDGLGPPETTG